MLLNFTLLWRFLFSMAKWRCKLVFSFVSSKSKFPVVKTGKPRLNALRAAYSWLFQGNLASSNVLTVKPCWNELQGRAGKVHLNKTLSEPNFWLELYICVPSKLFDWQMFVLVICSSYPCSFLRWLSVLFFFFFCQYIFYKDGQIANRS